MTATTASIMYLCATLTLAGTSFAGRQNRHGRAVESGISLTVEVDQLRNSKGRVQFALYDRDGTIPDEHYKHWCKLGVAPITDGKAAFTFTGLPMGRYAVNILHDENANGKIDKGFMLPKEGIGFSNYSSVGPMNRPNFSKASFDLRQDVRVKVKVVYL